MDWKDQVEQVIQRYAGQGGSSVATQDPHEDFQQIAQTAPQNIVADGLAHAFRSDQTPPFSDMVSNLFGQSDPNQKAGLLSRLIGSLGPQAAMAIPALANFSGGNVSPAQADAVTPEQVQRVAADAERKNPAIVDEVSRFYAQHPQVVKFAGSMALTLALKHIFANRQRA